MQRSTSIALPTTNTPDILRQWLSVAAYIVMVVVNGLANILPLNGKNTKDISDSFDVYFVPAGYVFSIWGVIYLALLAYTIYQALPSQRENPALRSIGWLIILSCAANTAWLFTWHWLLLPLSLPVMLIFLGTLIAIYLRLVTGRARVSTAERWLVHLPFSIYLGWITVATIANATDLLYYLNWDGWGIGAQTWAVIMLAATIIIAALVMISRRDVAYLVVLVWAIAGIAFKQSDGDAPAVQVAAITAAVLVAIFAVASIFFRRQPRPQY